MTTSTHTLATWPAKPYDVFSVGRCTFYLQDNALAYQRASQVQVSAAVWDADTDQWVGLADIAPD